MLFKFSMLIPILFLTQSALSVVHAEGEQAEADFRKRFGMVATEIFSDPQTISLCHAIEKNDLVEIERLIDEGANVNDRGKWGVTPLFWAFPYNRLERFELLLEKGADPNLPLTEQPDLDFAFFENAGFTVTIAAAMTHFDGYFEAVLKHGGDVTLEDSLLGPMLHTIVAATINDQEDRIDLYLKYGGDLHARKQIDGEHAAYFASHYRSQYDLALWLLKKGIDPNAPVDNDPEGKSFAYRLGYDDDEVLTQAAVMQTSYFELVRYLEEHGADFAEIQRTQVGTAGRGAKKGLPPGETEYFFKHRYEQYVIDFQTRFRNAMQENLSKYDRSTEAGRERWERDYQVFMSEIKANLKRRGGTLAGKGPDDADPRPLERYPFYTASELSWKFGVGLQLYLDVIPELLGRRYGPQWRERDLTMTNHKGDGVGRVPFNSTDRTPAELRLPVDMPPDDPRLRVEFKQKSSEGTLPLRVYITKEVDEENATRSIEEGGHRITMDHPYLLSELGYIEWGLIRIWIEADTQQANEEQQTSETSGESPQSDELHVLSATLTGIPNFDPPTGTAKFRIVDDESKSE